MPAMRGITWESFGPLLHAIRTRQRLTQDELAERVGCGRRHIARLEAGTRHPGRSLLRLLAGLPNLSEEERVWVAAFEQMRECHSGECEVAEAGVGNAVASGRSAVR